MDTIQEMLGKSISNDVDINVDINFVVDATDSMEPLIEAVKHLTLSLKDKVAAGLKEKCRVISQLRVKVTVFRDYYVDENDAMEESRFFILPEEEKEFRKVVSNIRCGGGGDEPESGLEALAVAMNTEWINEGDKRRHIICLFTDAPAHPLEQQRDGIPDCYPKGMFKTINELYNAWGKGQTSLYNAANKMQMDTKSKRLILFAPKTSPWVEMAEDLDNVWRVEMKKNNGGRDLDTREVVKSICESV